MKNFDNYLKNKIIGLLVMRCWLQMDYALSFLFRVSFCFISVSSLLYKLVSLFSTINNFFKIKKNINPKDCIFISSHEPCSLCLSGITWSGFDNFIYLYPYEDTKSDFNIPHDLKILDQVFKIKKGKYNRNNHYWKSYSIIK